MNKKIGNLIGNKQLMDIPFDEEDDLNEFECFNILNEILFQNKHIQKIDLGRNFF
jgi:hypothetical protein